MKESYIEGSVKKYAVKNGWLTLKLKEKGWPDRLFIKDGKHIYIEFKQPGLKPTKLQQYRIDELIKHNAKVYIIDDINAGKTLFT